MEKKNRHTNVNGLQQAYRASFLIAGFIRQTLTDEEREELDSWIVESKENMRLFGELTEEQNIATSLAAFEKMNAEHGLIETKRKLKFRKTIRPRAYAVAVSVIILAGITFFISKRSGKNKTGKNIVAQAKDITPGTYQATLTLGNGKVIVLDSAKDTLISDKIKVSGAEGEIVYGNGMTEQGGQYHLLSIPRKAHYRLVLPDGSKVWLNAGSSIKFPAAFNGNERKVYVTGETFFELAEDKTKPFRVVAGKMMVEGLGTQFNISAYSNEPVVSATLVEGLVKIAVQEANEILQPGEQAQLRGMQIKKVKTETGDVVAWKNNEFKFHNTPLEVIMRQVERWYDAEVLFKDKIDVHLNATIERGVPVSKLLQLLQATGHVKFTVEEKKIIVSRP